MSKRHFWRMNSSSIPEEAPSRETEQLVPALGASHWTRSVLDAGTPPSLISISLKWPRKCLTASPARVRSQRPLSSSLTLLQWTLLGLGLKNRWCRHPAPCLRLPEEVPTRGSPPRTCPMEGVRSESLPRGGHGPRPERGSSLLLAPSGSPLRPSPRISRTPFPCWVSWGVSSHRNMFS